MFEYDYLLQLIENKYRDVFASLYTINDDILDENLLYYLFNKRFMILKPDKSEHHLWSGEGNEWDRYGKVVAGFARYPDQRGGYKTVPFNENNSVVIYANRNKISIREYIWQYLTEIASILYTEQSNLRLSNVKGVIEGTTSTGDRLIQIFDENLRADKSWVVVKSKQALGEELTKLDLNVEYIADKYQKSVIFYHNQILELLGVNFVPIEKAERQVVDEVNANNELTMSISDKYVKMIQKQLDKYNDMFNTSFTIEKSIIRETDTETVEDEGPENEVD